MAICCTRIYYAMNGTLVEHHQLQVQQQGWLEQSQQQRSPHNPGKQNGINISDTSILYTHLHNLSTCETMSLPKVLSKTKHCTCCSTCHNALHQLLLYVISLTSLNQLEQCNMAESVLFCLTAWDLTTRRQPHCYATRCVFPGTRHMCHTSTMRSSPQESYQQCQTSGGSDSCDGQRTLLQSC